MADQAQQVGFHVGGQGVALAAEQFAFEEQAAVLHGLVQPFAGTQLGNIGQGIEQFVDAATQTFRQCLLAPCALQGFEQAFQRALAVLLAGQLLA
ncbi:hypothetical protein D3C71_1715960 [compost metagenome]